MGIIDASSYSPYDLQIGGIPSGGTITINCNGNFINHVIISADSRNSKTGWNSGGIGGNITINVNNGNLDNYGYITANTYGNSANLKIPKGGNIEISVNNGNFTQLVAALEKAGLVDALNGDGPFTVFAPTDEAFEQLYEDLGIGGIDDLTAEDLTPVLLYHVANGNVLSTDLEEGDLETLNGKSITIEIGESVTINDEAVVIAVDIQGTNGVVHVIDMVLLPPE